jgi:hypothetical protein
LSEKDFHPSFGWKLAPPDGRDYHIRNFLPKAVPLPAAFSWRTYMTQKKDQGEVGACVAFAWSFVIDFLINQGASFYQYFDHSPRFIYSRRANAPGEGMDNRDAADITLNLGDCLESLCPGIWYGITNADQICGSGTDSIMQDALTARTKSYARCYNTSDMMQAIYQIAPIVWGGPVFESWVTAPATNTGVIPMPGPNDSEIGGHDICVDGWTADGYLEFITPWWLIPKVKPWGDGCFGKLPLAYADMFLSDGEADSFSATPRPPGPQPPKPKTCIEKFDACQDDFLTCLANLILCYLGFGKPTGRQVTQMKKKLNQLGVK